jgi:hypothetical protein
MFSCARLLKLIHLFSPVPHFVIVNDYKRNSMNIGIKSRKRHLDSMDRSLKASNMSSSILPGAISDEL